MAHRLFPVDAARRVPIERGMIARLVETGLKPFGLRLQRRRPERDPVQHLVLKAAEHGISTILDVGANRGQFGHLLRDEGYTGRIVSFEPLPTCHAALQTASRSDPSWDIAPRCALGSSDGTAEMRVAENLVSSSILPVMDRSTDTHAPSRQIACEEVPLHRLDTLLDLTRPGPFALKIDTQGFELEVLKGATETLKDTPLVLLEMSLAPLYEGGAGFAELYAWMEQAGYRCIGITPGFSNVEHHEQLQADALFVR